MVTLLVVLLASTWIAQKVDRRGLAWLVLGTVLSVAIAMTSPAEVVQTASAGVAIASAMLLVGALDVLREQRGWLRRASLGSCALGLLSIQTAYAAISARREMSRRSVEQREAHRTIVSAELGPAPRTVVAIAGRDFAWDALAAMNLFRPDLPLHAWWAITHSNTETEVSRTGPRRIEIGCLPVRCSLVPIPTWFRAREFPMLAGDEVALDGIRVRIVSSGSEGPNRIEVDLEGDPGSTSLVAFEDGAYHRVRAPEVGERLLFH
jgi:hypothetical protein